MPSEAPTVLEHRGTFAALPARFDCAAATYLMSLFDFGAASRLCEGEFFEPLGIRDASGLKKAVGFVCFADYDQTGIGPYREWTLAVWVTPKGRTAPDLTYVNAASLAFYGFLADAEGFMFYAPKLVLTEALPVEIGIEHYGLPKELGEVEYFRDKRRTELAVATADGAPIMKVSVPTTRGILARIGAGLLPLSAFGLRVCIRGARRKELPTMIAGSAKLQAKRGLIVSVADPHAEFFEWSARDCVLSINGDSPSGKVLNDLMFAPALVCHLPNLAFVLSGPMDQVAPRHRDLGTHP